MPRFRKDGSKVINSRAKGAEFERKVANLLKGRGFIARRGVQFNGKWTADVETENFPYHIECKNVQSLNLFDALAQSEKDCPKGKIPIVVHTKVRKKILVSLEFHDFINLLQWGIGILDSLNGLELSGYLTDGDLL